VPVLLDVDGVTASYGKVEVLHELSMAIPAGSVVALLGANGAGKTTTLRAISGTLPIRSGAIRLGGRRLDGRSVYEVARAGVLLVPEGRGVFPILTVRENLAVACRAARGLSGPERQSRVEGVLDTFPRLRERLGQRAGSLSGGEQQMLALCRALLAEPRVLMMDEISMGLAPLIVEQLFASVERLKAAGMTIVMVEQYLTYALRLADVCYVLAKGRVAFVGEPSELQGGSALAAAYLGSG
jgi:branched-chain amino acid transport system ATP-binding protein